jgi:hypothetical protein
MSSAGSARTIFIVSRLTVITRSEATAGSANPSFRAKWHLN